MALVRVSTCIVGGGPAGLMLGLLPAKRGVDVLVLEGSVLDGREGRQTHPERWIASSVFARRERRARRSHAPN